MAPPQRQTKPSTYLIALGVIFVILYSIVYFGGSGSTSKRFQPKLGQDLIGGTQVTLQAQTVDGKKPSADILEQARQIISNRVNGLGVSEAQVVTEGSNIVITLAGSSNDQLKQVGSAAELRFRTVLSSTSGVDTAATASPSAAASGTPAASGSAAPSGSAAATASATPKANASATATAPASAAASAPASAVASAPAASAAPSVSAAPVSGDIATRRAALQKKLGPAVWTAGNALTAPIDFSKDQTGASDLYAPLKNLKADEVAVLPVAMQFNIPYVTCAMLNARPAASIVQADQQAVACDDTQTKYQLDVAKVLGTDVSKATAGTDPTTGAWEVVLSFKSSGQNRWTNLTKEAYGDGTNKKQVAVVLDNNVVSAPTINSVIPGDATISGSFDSKSANLLASELRYGALPVTFTPADTVTISATLGSAQLRAGLLAAGIGMLLVIVYAFFYYRLLGSVIFFSLILSGLLVFGALIVLGRSAGFTLTLSGIAGFIVSLGVAADSFVIYFERLKDEIRDGRSPRSAVPRAWARARRTIISANTISILAAVILYIFSVGTVKGFAFALGLATILDLLVVFLFRHPIMTMFANTKAFLSPRVSGLGRVLRHRTDDEATGGTAAVRRRGNRVKEA